MPVPIRTREYGSAESYQGFMGNADTGKQVKKDIEELWE
jgi:hypothetical protein